MYKFSKKSIIILDTVNKYLKLAALETIKESVIDISIADWGGLRTAEMQNGLFKKGYSRADGYKNLSFHQSGEALDLCAYKNGLSWNKQRLVYINTLFGFMWNKLKNKGEIPKNIYLHQGLFWTAKGGGMGWDLGHNEIRTYEQIYNIK